MLQFYLLYAVIHDMEKSTHCTLLYETYRKQISYHQMLLGHTFVFGDIGLRRKKTLKLKNQKKFKNLGSPALTA